MQVANGPSSNEFAYSYYHVPVGLLVNMCRHLPDVHPGRRDFFVNKYEYRGGRFGQDPIRRVSPGIYTVSRLFAGGLFSLRAL